jgi:hypothetical protein
MNKMLLEKVDLRFGIWIGRCQKTSRTWSGAGWYGSTAGRGFRAAAPGAFTKGQDGTLGV